MKTSATFLMLAAELLVVAACQGTGAAGPHRDRAVAGAISPSSSASVSVVVSASASSAAPTVRPPPARMVIPAPSSEIYWPRADERLPTPVKLADCPGISIIEWKQSTYSALSKPTASVYAKLNTRCKQAKSAFVRFAKKKYGVHITDELDSIPYSISFLSANQHHDGRTGRNLNDPARFSTIKFGMQWGHINYSLRYILLRNDPYIRETASVYSRVVDNNYFYETFVHELTHAFSHLTRIRGGELKTDEDEEAMVGEFLRSLGFSTKEESAADTARRIADP